MTPKIITNKNNKEFYRVVEYTTYVNGEKVTKKKVIGGKQIVCITPADFYRFKEFKNREEAEKYFNIKGE